MRLSSFDLWSGKRRVNEDRCLDVEQRGEVRRIETRVAVRHQDHVLFARCRSDGLEHQGRRARGRAELDHLHPMALPSKPLLDWTPGRRPEQRARYQQKHMAILVRRSPWRCT